MPIAYQFILWKLLKYAIHLSTKSAGTFAIWSPKKSLICEEKIMSAIPLVKPTMSEYGMYFSKFPSRANPKPIMIKPAIKVAMVNPSVPYC